MAPFDLAVQSVVAALEGAQVSAARMADRHRHRHPRRGGRHGSGILCWSARRRRHQAGARH
ncbi:hypothetical protein [Nonomuraea sp. NPDC049400]|uniref:hypothetical protein n=1 Tax=Nonomuraea sp. NPDC049400 TaxID=3364352 RepID=UPI003788E047